MKQDKNTADLPTYSKIFAADLERQKAALAKAPRVSLEEARRLAKWIKGSANQELKKGSKVGNE